MRNLIKNTFLLLAFSTSAFAIDSGSLDTSFSNDVNSPGWDLNAPSGGGEFTTDTVIDTQGRVLVAGEYRAQGATDYNPIVRRYLKNGQLDTTFSDNGTFLWPIAYGWSKVQIGLTTEDDNIFFLAFETGTDNKDVNVVMIDSSTTQGYLNGVELISFDLGSAADRKDDFLADMLVTTVPTTYQGSVVLALEVERTNANDTDFGIAKINYDIASPSLALDTSFSSDGLANCYFDQNSTGFGEDKATSIHETWHGGYIVGGSTFEGNGDDSNGWNASFCEFNLSGGLVKRWSTLNPNAQVDSREFLADIAVSSDTASGGEYMLALTKEPEIVFSNDYDFVVRKYLYNNGNWDLDTSFGTNGKSRIGFVDGYLFPSDTSDEPVAILVEDKNSQILVAGTSQWFDTNNDLNSHMALAKLNADGSLNSSWGTSQNGKAYVTLDNSSPTVFRDTLTTISEDKNSEKIYIGGNNIQAGNQLYSSISRVHNDLIFKSGF